jgi:hypothetical protein
VQAAARIIRQLLTEGLVLAVLGGAVGMILGLWSSDLLIASIGPLLPFDIAWQSGPDVSTIAATFGFCVLATFAFAFGPALKLSRNASTAYLKEHAGEDVVRRRWKFLPRNPLVAVQIGCSLALLTAAFLFVRGAGKAASVDTGLQPGESFLVELDASLSGYDRPARAAALQRDRATARRASGSREGKHLCDGAFRHGAARQTRAPGRRSSRAGHAGTACELQQRRRGLLRHGWLATPARARIYPR